MTNATITKAIQPQIAVLRCCALHRPARAAKVLACTRCLLRRLREVGFRPVVRLGNVPAGPAPDHADRRRPGVGLTPWSALGASARLSGPRVCSPPRQFGGETTCVGFETHAR